MIDSHNSLNISKPENKLIKQVFKHCRKDETNIYPFRIIDEFFVKKHRKNGSLIMIYLKFTENFILYSKEENFRANKICFYDEHLKVRFIYDENNTTKILKICLVKDPALFIFTEAYDDGSNEKIEKILKGKISLLGFHDNYNGIRIIGKGSFAKVFLAVNRFTNKEKAIKVISKEEINSKPIGKELISHEIKIMRAISFPHIIELEAIYETEKSYYMVLPIFKGGNLKDLILKSTFLSEKESAKILKVLLKSLNYLHVRQIMHRDLKPDNILFKTTKCEAKDIFLADFGLACHVEKSSYSIHKCGTPGYIAPEILNVKDLSSSYDTKCDIFSLGILFYNMMTGKLPYLAKNQNELLIQNSKCDFYFKTQIFSHISDNAKKLFFQMIEKDPHKRISAAEALAHEFLIETPIKDEIEDDIYSDLPFENITKINKRKFDFNGMEFLNASAGFTFGSNLNLERKKTLAAQTLVIIKPSLNGNTNTYVSSFTSVNEMIFEKIMEVTTNQVEDSMFSSEKERK